MEKYIKRKKAIYAALGAAAALPVLFFARHFISEAFKLTAIAGALAVVLCPLCAALENKFSRPLAAGLCVFAAVTAAAAAVCAVIIPLSACFSDIYERLPAMMDAIHKMLDKTGGGAEMLREKAFIHVSGAIGGILSGVVGAAGFTADLVLAVVLAWHMLTVREQLALRAELMLPAKKRAMIIRNARDAQIEITMYLRGQATIALCVGVLSAVGLLMIGIPYAVPLGFTAGVLNMIPYLGPVIACVPVGIIALVEGILPAALSILVLIAVQQIDGLILSPRIVGGATGFPPAAVMVAVFASGAAWGIPGMLAVLPLLILIRTCVRVFVELGRTD